MLVSSAATPVTPSGLYRVWVSGHGTDSAGCGGPTSPCRTLQYAHDNIVLANGEIDILDPAGYGAVTIGKALSIVNDGVGTAGVQQANAALAGITINAGASDAIYLRGLNIDGLGTGEYGILSISGGSLAATNCVVRHFQFGIIIAPTSGATVFSLSNTNVSDNAGAGILVYPTGSGSTKGTIIGGDVGRNGENGIEVHGNAAAGTASFVSVSDANVSNNGSTGVLAMADATLGITRTTATGNDLGLVVGSPATVYTYGDNRISGNASANVVGNLTSVSGN